VLSFNLVYGFDNPIRPFVGSRSRVCTINWTAKGTIKGNAIPFSGRNKELSNGVRALKEESEICVCVREKRGGQRAERRTSPAGGAQ